MFYCFDPNFGLVLKKSASKSQKAPVRAENLFIPDSIVDNYMKHYDDGGKETKVITLFCGKNNHFVISRLHAIFKIV